MSLSMSGPTGPAPVEGRDSIVNGTDTGTAPNAISNGTKFQASQTDSETGAVVPASNHMKRARFYQKLKRPNLLHYRDDYYDYDEGRYTTVDDSTIKADVWAFLDTCRKTVTKDGKFVDVAFVPNTKSVSETINALLAVTHLPPTVEQPCWLDGRAGPDPSQLISFPNGILNLNTNHFTQPDPMLFTPHGVAFDYDPNAPTPVEWLKFLNQIFAGEQDQIDALQEMFGYCLSSDVSQEKTFLWIGPPRSGKDTGRHALQSLISPKAVCGPTLDSMGNTFGMSALIGKQLAIVGDMRLGSKCDKDLLAENILKLSGRGLFTIDRKHKEHWTGSLPCKLLLISNEMPKIKDTSGALASRMIIFETRVSFYGCEDPHLFRDKIKPELAGILNWSLEGLRRIRQRGSIAETACSKQALEDLAREGSPVMAFVQECLTLDAGASVSKDVLFSTYRNYADRNGLPPTSKSWFFRDLETATAGKIKTARMRRNGEPDIHNIVGIRINPSGAATPPATQTSQDVGAATGINAALDECIERLQTGRDKDH